jgi:hypothetical protein
VLELVGELALELRVGGMLVGGLQLVERMGQRLGDEAAAVRPEVARRIGLVVLEHDQ